MAQVVTKFRYLKSGQGKQAAKYLKYIATRDGVVKIDDTFKLKPATKNQQEFIDTIVKDFPDCKEMHEYKDYLKDKTVGNASEFITRALEDNAFEMVDSKTYADYIATRPRVQKFGTHGLFSDRDEPIELEKISKELLSYKGNVWTVIISLRREDAVEYGYDHGERWRDMLRGQTEKLSSALHIPMTDLKWYAAFHDESYHPHVHLIAYAEHSKNGYLDEKGINSLRSAFANAIFDRKLIKLYEEQTVERDELRSVSREIIGDIIAKINAGTYENPLLEEKLVELADKLSKINRTKKYGYMPQYIKGIVNLIVDEIAKDERISTLYDKWYELRESIVATYTSQMPERVPLSENDTFKPIRNAVIDEAMNIVLNRMPTEEPIETVSEAEEIEAEIEDTLNLQEHRSTMWQLYRQAKEYLDKDSEDYNPDKAVELLVESAEYGNSIAKYKLGKMYLLGLDVPKNITAAVVWLEDAIEDGNEYAEYLLGKTLLRSEDVDPDYERGEELLRTAADKGNPYALYTLGKELLKGEVLDQNDAEGLLRLQQSADKGFSTAQYLLGKLFYEGEVVSKDVVKAIDLLEKAVAQGNHYAAYIAGKIRLFESEFKNVDKALRYLKLAAENKNSWAEYLLGKLYLYGNEVPRDIDTGLAYMRSAAEHGNSYAAEVVKSIESNKNWMATMGIIRLFHHVGRTIRNQIDSERKDKGGSSIDRKLKRQIDDKKQAQGLKQG